MCLPPWPWNSGFPLILPGEILQKLYETWPVARLATVSAQQQPHLVPVVFCENRGDIFSPLDGKAKSGRPLQRIQNVTTNPHVTLLLDDYSPDWETLWWVRVDGMADLFEPAVDKADQITARLLAKYPQYRDPRLMFDTSFFIRVRPAKISCWTQSGSSAPIDDAVSRLTGVARSG
jgi:PPOX class probable F420-dependent enzyme